MRLKNIVLMDLMKERLVVYEELERAMNKKCPIDESVNKIKNHLQDIARLNGMINEWHAISESEASNEGSGMNKKTENE
jgi:hypothetical protein